jgi:hypothetical protein
MSKSRRKRVTFIATKVVSRPATIKFYTRSGKEVKFKGHKHVPKSVRVEFFARKKKK